MELKLSHGLRFVMLAKRRDKQRCTLLRIRALEQAMKHVLRLQGIDSVLYKGSHKGAQRSEDCALTVEGIPAGLSIDSGNTGVLLQASWQCCQMQE